MLSVTLTLGMLLASSGVAVQEGGAAEKQFQKFEQAFAAEQAAFQEAFTALQASDEWKKAMEARDNAALQGMYEKIPQPDAAAFAEKALAAAEEYKGEAGAFLFLRWTLMNVGTPDSAVTVLQHLIEDHLEHKELGDCVDVLPRFAREQEKGPYLDFLAAVIEESPSKEVQANAYFVRGQYYGGGDEDLKMCVKLAPDSVMAMRANAEEFERTRLQIGMEAPDIVGPDLDGVEFKLSDYRGKVVVIDFWGDW